MLKSTVTMFKKFLVLSLLPMGVQAVTDTSYEFFANGEKAELSKPEHTKKIFLHMAREEFETWTIRLPHTSTKSDLISDIEIKWTGARPDHDFNVYWLGVHPLKKSSTHSHQKVHQVADIAIPLELLKMKQVKIPAHNTPKHPEYLFEFFVKKDAKPGIYSGNLTWKSNKKIHTLPLSLEVFPLALGSKFDLKTSIGFAPWEVLKKHHGKWHVDEHKLYDLYYREAHLHRIDLHKVYIKFPEKGSKDPLSEAKTGTFSFLRQTEPLFSGEYSPYGFRFSISDLPVPEEYKNVMRATLSEKEISTFWKNLNQSVVKNRLKNKSFVYFIDEPKSENIAQLAFNLKKIREWAPDIKFLVTTPYQQSLEGAVNLWCINLILWDRPTEKSPTFYLDRKTNLQENYWFYVGCNSHGCEGAENIENPDLVMDRGSAYHRVFPWMAFRYDAEGILYYDSVYGYSHGTIDSPWEDSFAFTGYGEGNLFYPCSPLIAGCKDNRVFSSVRLKALRDGLEDVQILKTLEAKGVSTKTKVQSLIPGVRSFPVHTKAYEDLKVWALKAHNASVNETKK